MLFRPVAGRRVSLQAQPNASKGLMVRSLDIRVVILREDSLD
ncbi:hypothetical protein [Methylobacterium iners]|nr:hypothetical protein [Methylobacterium iners]